MGLFKRDAPKAVSREQAEEILGRADVQEKLRQAGIDPAILEQQLEHSELKVSGGKTTITVKTTMQIPQGQAPPSDGGDDPWKSGKL